MPCDSGGYDETPAELDRAVKTACDLVRTIRKYGHHKLFDKIKPATRAWIKEHDKLDAERKKEEKREKKEQEVKGKALKKLTKQERKLLMLGDEG